MSVFARFAPRLQQAIVARLGWTSLRPVQELAGEAILAGQNAVVLAPTAGGKTEAALFPLLSNLVERPPTSVGVVYVAPIKALLNNQAERLGLYTEMVGLDRFVWHGDTSDSPRRRFLREPTELLMTTPESLEVMLISERVDTAALFADLRAVVIDEVHALAGTDRGAHLMSVLERLAKHSTHDVQRLGLSATVGNPTQILAWLTGTSSRPGVVVDPPKVPAKRNLLIVHSPERRTLATRAARLARGGKSLVFCQSRADSEEIAGMVRQMGTPVFVHHSAVSREERLLAEERFHSGSEACIVCTSTLELGIDVGDLDRVLQVDAPDTVGSFLQRMGRTGRRSGQTANTTFLCETAWSVLQAVALIELAREGWVENVAVQDRCWPVLLHQLLALALEQGGVTDEAAWDHLSRVPDFRGIERPEFDRLLAWLVQEESLVRASGRLVLGPRAEKRFGRRHFMELYAVFSSPQSYTVQTANAQPIGTLQQGFVDKLVDGVSSFLLGGRAWAVLGIDHDSRRVLVEAAPFGRIPRWGGFVPQFLSFEVCQRVARFLRADDTPAYLHASAAKVVAEMRPFFQHLLSRASGGLETDEEETRWWTFAGGHINETLRYALTALAPGATVTADNYALHLAPGPLSGARFDDALKTLRDPTFWTSDEFWKHVAATLPAFRLSKFQPLMPPWVEREVLSAFLIDTERTKAWLNKALS